MSLTSAFQIARSALTTSQLGIQLAGNNMANAATPGYTRQTALLGAIEGTGSDMFRVGRGVGVAGLQREINEALQSRLRQGISSESSARAQLQVFDQLEAALNELSGFDLSTELSGFFNVWSEAANLTQSDAVVVEHGDKLASFMRSLRGDLAGLRGQIEDQLDSNVSRANELFEEVAVINAQIRTTEGGQSTASALRDRRDEILSELSELMDISTIEDNQGNIDVLVGSIPVVLGGENRGIEIEREPVDGVLTVNIRVGADGSPLPVTSGRIGGLIAARDGSIDETIDKIDSIASQLIFEVNKLHSTGVDSDWFTSIRASRQIGTDDQTLPFNDPSSVAFGDLPFAAENGGFFINVERNGAIEQVRIDVDLDGITDAGTAGIGDDSTPEDIRAALNDVDGITATFGADGKLNIQAAAGVTFSFQDDSSGVLAIMGVNSYFTGDDAKDIGIRQDLLDDPTSLTLGRMVGDQFVENGTALGIVDIQQTALESLGGVSIEDSWSNTVQRVAVKTSTAQTQTASSTLVRQSLEAQRASVSGVSIDEESVNLLNYQRQYQGAARLVTIADELLQTLISLV